MIIKTHEQISASAHIYDYRHDTNYFKRENVSIKVWSSGAEIVNLENALNVGKKVVKIRLCEKVNRNNFECDLSNWLQDNELTLSEFINIIKDEKITTQSFVDLFEQYQTMEQGTRVFSPFVEVKPIKEPKKWTLPHIWKAILSGQATSGTVDQRLTDDYAYDAATDFGRGEMDLQNFARDIIESPSGWWVMVDKEDDETIQLGVNCHHFDCRTVVFNKNINKENAPQQEVAESAEIKETVQPENNIDKKETQTTIINLAGRINEQLAKRAKENISFSDYKTGSATAEYNQHMSEVLTAIENAKTKVSDEGKERLDRLYSRHAANYANWINKHNANGASHVSVMIAGPSNYNMRKHEQYLNREGKLWEEYDKLKDIFWNINSIIDGDKIIKSGDPSAIEKLKEKLINALKEHQEYKDYNAKARKEGTDQLAPYILQNSNGRIKSIRDRIARLERAKQQGTKEIEVKTNDAETIRIVDNVDAYRIQIFFPGKPDAEVRTKLKKNGFRWAPSVSAWQAHRNHYNLDKAKEIISSI